MSQFDKIILTFIKKLAKKLEFDNHIPIFQILLYYMTKLYLLYYKQTLICKITLKCYENVKQYEIIDFNPIWPSMTNSSHDSLIPITQHTRMN